MTKYDAIFKRKSIKNFKKNPLPPEKLDWLKEELRNLKPLYPEIETSMLVLNGSQLFKKPAAPHYVLLWSADEDGYLENGGFLLEQLVLSMTAAGVGSCYQSIPPRGRKDLDLPGLKYVIMLAAGEAKGQLLRRSVKAFRRRRLSLLAPGGNPALMEPVRLAPSSLNGQPWLFFESKTAVQIFCRRPDPILGKMIQKLNRLDVGVAMCHLDLAAGKTGLCLRFKKYINEPQAPKGYYYIATAEKRAGQDGG